MRYVAIFLAALVSGTLLMRALAHADPLTNLSSVIVDQRIQCPDATPCKVLVLTAQEEKILIGERGILATAAQARALDLGSLATYFEQKISKAPAGDQKEPPKPAEGNPALPTGQVNPAK